MQSKVSMVIPCYNKVKYIANMFDSILAQEWGNIELILVNDGSTDGTRDIIAEYEPEFIARGYEVVIVDQENAGVCAAVKAGLELITGEYVCQVDSDDELDPGYVSTMVGCLEDNLEYDYCVCGHTAFNENECERIIMGTRIPNAEDGYFSLKDFLLFRTRYNHLPWQYFLRVSYFRKCKIIESYYTKSKGSHEPGYIIPILANGGRAVCLKVSLYNFRCSGTNIHHSYCETLEKAKSHSAEYLRLTKIALQKLGNRHVYELITFARLGLCNKHFLSGKARDDVKILKKQLAEEKLKILNDYFFKYDPIPSEILTIKEGLALFEKFNFTDYIFDRQLHTNIEWNLRGRKIGICSKGKDANLLLPLLNKAHITFDKLWDKSLGNTDYASVDKEDTLFVFSAKKSIMEEIKCETKQLNCKIYFYNEIIEYLILHCLVGINE